MSEHDPDESGPRHLPRNRGVAPSKLRRDGRHCPVCLAALPKNAGRTRRVRFCPGCQAHPSPGKRCLRCGAGGIWENKQTAACGVCAHHGAKRDVISPNRPA